jgi:hypothetical protein
MIIYGFIFLGFSKNIPLLIIGKHTGNQRYTYLVVLSLSATVIASWILQNQNLESDSRQLVKNKLVPPLKVFIIIIIPLYIKTHIL